MRARAHNKQPEIQYDNTDFSRFHFTLSFVNLLSFSILSSVNLVFNRFGDVVCLLNFCVTLHGDFLQKDTKQLKQLTSIHSSHEIALSQTYPNNLTGGVLS